MLVTQLRTIEDQKRECRKFAKERGYSVKDEHIFEDKAKTGTHTNRRDLDRLRQVARTGAFQKLIVLNLARLSRDLLDLLHLREEFARLGIEILSAQEGLESFEDNSTLELQLRGMFNQMYVDSIRRETRRGQVGNIERGFLAGGLGYGYRTVKTGKLNSDPDGRIRGEGSIPEVIPHEAEVIRRIYRSFIDNKSITQIVKDLNDDHVPSRKGKGWNESTVSKILKNERYTGKYIWGKTANRRNPITGKVEKRDQPRENWMIREWDTLRIISDEVWAQAQARWKKIRGTFPPDDGGGAPAGAGRGWPGHRGYSETNAKYLLSGCLKCSKCGGAINLVSGKGDGYYGCQMAHVGVVTTES